MFLSDLNTIGHMVICYDFSPKGVVIVFVTAVVTESIFILTEEQLFVYVALKNILQKYYKRLSFKII